MRKTIIAISLLAVFVSCSDKDDMGVEYVPYQETEGGQWCMISPGGEVLFTEEFKNAPTVVKEGRFMVRNDKGLWEIFTAEAKPKKIGNEYAYASCFYDGRALVAERNEHVKIINLNGEEVKQLDKVDGKHVDAVFFFHEGYAIYQTGDYYGAINIEGESVIKADYLMLYSCSDGKFIGIHKRYESVYRSDSLDKKITYDVLDTTGKKLFEIKSEKYSNIGARFIDGLLTVAIERDGKQCWGLINDQGEEVVRPAEKIKGISDIKGNRFVYTNGEGYGVMTTDGENLIRAKYDFLYFDVSDRLVAITEKTKGSGSYECKFIDDDDNQIGTDKYVSINPLSNFDGEHSFVKISDRIWSIVDKDGQQIKRLPDIVNINLASGDVQILDDHVDFAALFDEMGLGEKNIDGMELGITNAEEAALRHANWLGNDSTLEHPWTDPYWYDYTNNTYYYKEFLRINTFIYMSFPQNLSRRTYRTEVEYYYYFSFRRNVPTGYAFNNTKASSFGVEFRNQGKMQGKLEMLLSELKARFSNYGRIAKENNGAAVFELNCGNRAMVSMDENVVRLVWGDLKPVDELDIEEYKDKRENIQPDQTIIQVVNANGVPIRLSPISNDSTIVADSIR
ncbi:MAG: WG repeat-containing protein [Prevotella sp.]|nr:WG repeat-containing protein [Prevotella sp.]